MEKDQVRNVIRDVKTARNKINQVIKFLGDKDKVNSVQKYLDQHSQKLYNAEGLYLEEAAEFLKGLQEATMALVLKDLRDKSRALHIMDNYLRGVPFAKVWSGNTPPDEYDTVALCVLSLSGSSLRRFMKLHIDGCELCEWINGKESFFARKENLRNGPGFDANGSPVGV
jgi:hypothetical protein